jgi:hypothetical protein
LAMLVSKPRNVRSPWLAPLNRWIRAWSGTASVSLAGRNDPFCLVATFLQRSPQPDARLRNIPNVGGGDAPSLSASPSGAAENLADIPAIDPPSRQRRVALVRSISTCSPAHLETLNGETGEVILGSGQRALAATPPFTRVVLCEHQTMDWRRYAAVFAMVDRYSAEETWETPKYLSTWRLNRRGFKVGLRMYLGHELLLGLSGLAGRQLVSSAVRSRVSQVRAAWRSPSSSS